MTKKEQKCIKWSSKEQLATHLLGGQTQNNKYFHLFEKFLLDIYPESLKLTSFFERENFLSFGMI